MIEGLRGKIAAAAARLREVQQLVDVAEVTDHLRHELEWASYVHAIGQEALPHAQAFRRAADLLKDVRLPDPQFICPQHPFAQIHVKSKAHRVGDPDEEGTVYDRDVDVVTVYGVCSLCLRDVWNETPTSQLIRGQVRDVLTQARADLIDAARAIEDAARSAEATAEVDRDACLIREALAHLGLDPAGGEDALLAWATAPERHDTLRWRLDPADGCFGDIRNLRRPAARIAEVVVAEGS